MDENKYVDLDEMNIILRIPKNAKKVKLKITLENDVAKKVSTKLNKKAIKEARKAFLDNVELGDDYDSNFVITEEGKEYLEKILKEQGVDKNDNN